MRTPIVAVLAVGSMEAAVNTMAMPPVGQEFKSLSEQVYQALAEAIVQWRLRPGQRLVLGDLATQLRVSRTPVRDALARLVTLGLVEPTGRRGFCVTVSSASDLTHLFEVRLMCELFAVQIGLSNLTSPNLVQMEAVAENCALLSSSREPMDWLAASLQDMVLHGLIIDLAQNPKLSEIYERLNTHIHGLRAGRHRTPPEVARMLNETEHCAIIAVLRTGERVAAQAAISSHIVNARDRAIASLNWSEAGQQDSASSIGWSAR